MAVSAFDLFKIGIGPSSSHTVGPMRAARQFALRLEHHGLLERTARVRTELYGSLGATGRGHGTDKAILLGLEGEQPDAVDIDAIPGRLDAIRSGGRLRLLGRHEVAFDEPADLVFSQRISPDDATPFHTNNIRFTALGGDGGGARRGHLLLGRRRLRGQRRAGGRWDRAAWRDPRHRRPARSRTTARTSC